MPRSESPRRRLPTRGRLVWLVGLALGLAGGTWVAFALVNVEMADTRSENVGG